jgi:NADH dehydrogenase
VGSTILVTGGAGVMGSVLVKHLADAGNRVRVLTLAGDPNVSRLAGYDIDIRYGNVSDSSTLSRICDGVETVYHLAAIIIAFDERLYERINVGGTRAVVDEAVRSGVRHFIHVSSASVVYPRPTAYSLSKRAAEDIVKQSGMRWTIVRPTLVYDTGRGAEEFDRFLAYLDKFPFVPFIGNGEAVKRPVFVGDIIDGLVSLNGREESYGKTYNFSGGEEISMRRFALLCLRLMGKERKPVVGVPVWLCMVLSSLMRLVMKRPPLRWPVIAGVIQDANLDPSEAMRDLGYHPAAVSRMLPRCFPRI